MQFNVICQELERGATVIPALLSGVTSEQARVKPAPDAWSVLEVVGHLVDEERWDFRWHLDRMLHQDTPDQLSVGRPLPDHNPGQGLVHPYNEHDFAQTLDEFLAERKHSLEWLKTLSVPDWSKSVTIPFSSTGHITKAGDMLASWAAHDNLHMRQLVELRWTRLLGLVQPYAVEYAGGW
jgi:hypothetical protein